MFAGAVIASLGAASASAYPFFTGGTGPVATGVSLEESLAEPSLWRLAGFQTNVAALERVYGVSDHRSLWTGGAQAEKDAQRALEVLGHAGDEGLDPNDYRVNELAALREQQARLHDFEFLLSDSVVRYARDMRLGRVRPNDVDEDIDLPAKKFDAASELATTAKKGTIAQFLAGLEPAHAEYARLKAALGRYRKLAAMDWPMVPSEKTPERKDILRARLMIEDPALAAQSDADLVAALERYQRRNGLEADGILGPKTLAALNVPAADRITQIAANMERWRWLPDALETRYVMVNTADATLDVVDSGNTVLHSKVVVGSPDKRSPILRAAAVAVTVNPVWRIPSSIAKSEILPELQRNPNYLQDHEMILVGGPADDPAGTRIDWQSVTDFRYMVQQVPGAQNALGTLKLEMPNKFDVYLHDTPGKGAFTRDSRALSHGCVRVQNISELASLAWKGDPMSGLDELGQLIASGETKKVPLSERLPVYLVYWTARAGDDGVEFAPDVYGRDALLIPALRGERVSPRPLTELSI